MAKRQSKTTRSPRKKSSSSKSAAVQTVTSNKLDDIDLLNAHRYPESMPSNVVAHIRSSRETQKRLEELLKQVPSGRRNSKKDIAVFLDESSSESADEAPEQNSDEHDYDGEDYEETSDNEPSALKRLFRKKNQ